MLEKTVYRQLLSHAFDIPISVTYWDGKEETYGEGEPVVKVRMNEELPLKSFTDKPTLTLAEDYMRGALEIDGSIEELVASAYRTDHSFLTNNPFIKHFPKVSHSERTVKKTFKVTTTLVMTFMKCGWTRR